MANKYVSETGLTYFWNKIKAFFVQKEDGKGLSSNDFTDAEKTKLSGIATGANKYTHPSYTAKSSGLYKVTVDSSGHVSAATAVGKTDITNLGIPAQDTTYSTMTGASTTAAGTSGLTPAPAKGAANRYLRSDGTWQVPPDTNTTYSAATTSAAGLMSASDKTKLDSVASGANNYTLPTASTTLGGVKTTSTVTATTGLTASPIINGVVYYKDTNTTYSNMTAATASAAGKAGLVPAPAAGAQTKFLRGDGTWVVPTNTTYTAATSSKNGLMSSTDKAKLDAFGAASTYALKTDITAMYRFKGSVATVADLPTSSNTTGDSYNVTASGMNYVWTGTEWDALGEVFTINDITEAEIDAICV